MVSTNGLGRQVPRDPIGLLDFFAAHAPEEIPAWFEHVPHEPAPRPPTWQAGLSFEEMERLRQQAERDVGEWQRLELIARYLQWRWTYALLMVETKETILGGK